jgi:CRP/FNR family transcriptional regulator
MSTSASSRRLPYVATRAVSSAECARCEVRQRSIFRNAQAEDLEELHAGTERREHPAGDAIWREIDAGKGVFCLASGHGISRIVTPEGEAALTMIASPGMLVGLADVLAKKGQALRSDALTAVEGCFIPAGRLRAFLTHNAPVALGAAEFLATIRNALVAYICTHRTLPAPPRVMAVVLSLREAFGEALPDGTVRVRLPCSRRDLADLSAMTPATLSRTIAEIERRQIARFHERDVLILDLDEALDLADSGG